MAEFTTVTARFWSDFTKRKNSTHTPTAADVTATDGIEINCFHKTNTSVLSPVLEIHMVFAFTFHYAYINIFQRFYYINDCVSLGANQYRLFLRCDVLGSWKNILYGKRIFAQYTEKFYNVYLDDGRITPTTHGLETHRIVANTQTLEVLSNTPTVLCSMTTGGGDFGVEVWVGSNNLKTYINKLNSKSAWQALIEDFTGAEPLSYINGVWQVPFRVDKSNGTESNGGSELFDTLYVNDIVKNNVNKYTVDIDIPSLTALGVDIYRQNSRFVSYKLYLPFVGTVSLETNTLIGGGHIYIDYGADAISGVLSYNVSGGGSDYGCFAVNLRQSIPIGAVSPNGAMISNGQSSIVSGLATAAVGAVSGNPAAALIGAGGALGGAVQIMAQPQQVNTISGISGSLVPAYVERNKFPRVDIVVLGKSDSESQYSSVCGRPTNKIITLDAGIGFVQGDASGIDYAHIDGGDRVDNDAGVDKISNYHYGIYQSEIDEIISLVRGGVYFDD